MMYFDIEKVAPNSPPSITTTRCTASRCDQAQSLIYSSSETLHNSISEQTLTDNEDLQFDDERNLPTPPPLPKDPPITQICKTKKQDFKMKIIADRPRKVGSIVGFWVGKNKKIEKGKKKQNSEMVVKRSAIFRK